MSKPKHNKIADVITAILILAALLYSAVGFLSDRHLAAGVEIALGLLALVGVIAIIAMLLRAIGRKEAHKVFILYSDEDLAFVSKLYKALKITPYTILWDKKEIQVGDHIEEKQRQLLEESDDVIVVISTRSADSDWPESAIVKAIKLKKRILPVLIDDTEIPDALNALMFADFRASFDDGYFSLRDALKAERPEDPTPPSERKAAPNKMAAN
ncbi:toll/interleukin-1 receptor domain-containing protein [Thiorhodococcus minor]|uniref:Toll/interleukin-1 receptor domain-containing protein n=1 Tax=Thiorhodococcus minor TaxID=57489 RepID=A0A6M0JUF1_9GAMM|nr:toll/interleukin-1 receptor domain-containing protein [Thiorhodococcus minor]NEV61200.1 toll/interleukin-1 receptor domain-containing protein [Thiorhodococcus minor]